MLEIIALTAEDIRHAALGGANRVEFLGTMMHDGLSPTIEQIRDAVAVADEYNIQIRVMLRLSAGFLFSPETVRPIRDLIAVIKESGADGAVLGFLDRSGEIDFSALKQLGLGSLAMPLTFHRAIDSAENYFTAWEKLLLSISKENLQITQVLTAGAAQGMEKGLPNLLKIAKNPVACTLIMAGGGLREKHLPQLKNAGISAFHVGSAVRKAGKWNKPVDVELVRKWVRFTKSQ